MKACRFINTRFCPFDDSDQGPPTAGVIKSCSAFRPSVFCNHYNDFSDRYFKRLNQKMWDESILGSIVNFVKRLLK